MSSDEHQEELYAACRKGDLPKVKYLVENNLVDPLKDDSEAYKWASLCCQRKVVAYLWLYSPSR